MKNERQIQRFCEYVTEFVQKKKEGWRLSYSKWWSQKGMKTKSVNT